MEHNPVILKTWPLKLCSYEQLLRMKTAIGFCIHMVATEQTEKAPLYRATYSCLSLFMNSFTLQSKLMP